MTEEQTETPPEQPEPPKRPAKESPGGQPMGPVAVGLVTLYLVAVGVLVIHGLMVLWPPRTDGVELTDRLERIEAAVGLREGEAQTPAQGADPDQAPDPPAAGSPASRPAGAGAAGNETADRSCREGEVASPYLLWTFCLFPEERLFVIVLLAGALGGLVHSLRSFYWYLGNRELYLSWMGMYVTLPVVGAAMAVVFYLVIRGGFTPANASFEETNPFGFAAMAVLVGMFTEQAALRLKQVAETVFTKPQKGKEHAGPPEVDQVDPASGSVDGGEKVVVRGGGFKEGVVVRFGKKTADAPDVKDESTIEAKTPPADAAGPVTVEVLNPGGQKGSLPDGFTYN